MKKRLDDNKKDFVHLYLFNAEHDSRDKESARKFLDNEGVNTNKLVNDGLKRIRKMQLLINANKTKNEMEQLEKVKSDAIAWVDQLLGNVNFSLINLVKTEELTVSFRNLEELSQDDVRNILIRHFTLKFMNRENKDENGI